MSPNVCRSRKKHTNRYTHMHQLLILFAIIIQNCHIHVEAEHECHTYGCPLTAVDILYDEPTKEALHILRQKGSGEIIEEENSSRDASSGNNEYYQLREKALSALQYAGDETKTTMTLRGYKGGKMEDQINQDRAIVVSPLHIVSGLSKSTPVAQLLAVFDGHGEGGEKTSQYAVEHVPSLLAAKLASVFTEGNINVEKESNVVEILKETFREVDRNDPSRGDAGCTATVILRLEKKLFIANVGDSVSFVGVYIGGKSTQHHKIQIVYQSREDKPNLPEEKARIFASGGYVHIPPESNGDVPRAYYVDGNGRAQYGLAMSRSLGDWKVPGVIAEPIVDVLDLNEIKQRAYASYTESCSVDSNMENRNEYCDFSCDVQVFAISISDGMMDYLSLDNISETLAAAFFNHNRDMHPHSAAEKLIIDAAKGWEDEFGGSYRDDIAIASVVIPFI